MPERIPVTCRDARWMIITFEVPASMGYEAFRVQVPGVAGTQSLGVARMPVGSAFGGVLAPFGRPICAPRGVFGLPTASYVLETKYSSDGPAGEAANRCVNIAPEYHTGTG